MHWEEHEVLAPDVESRHTLLGLAKMTNNAYVNETGDPYWYDLGGNWTSVSVNESSAS
jgi:putative lipase involved disintegration of autophagic bodies